MYSTQITIYGLAHCFRAHRVRHGFKTVGGGGPKLLLNLKVSRSLVLIYIKLYKILILHLSTKMQLVVEH